MKDTDYSANPKCKMVEQGQLHGRVLLHSITILKLRLQIKWTTLILLARHIVLRGQQKEKSRMLDIEDMRIQAPSCKMQEDRQHDS